MQIKRREVREGGEEGGGGRKEEREDLDWKEGGLEFGLERSKREGISLRKESRRAAPGSFCSTDNNSNTSLA